MQYLEARCRRKPCSSSDDEEMLPAHTCKDDAAITYIETVGSEEVEGSENSKEHIYPVTHTWCF